MQYSPHWWLTEFRNVPILPGSFTGDMSRAFTVETLAPTGTPFGAYRLDGTRSRMNNQAVSFEFTYPSRCFDKVGQWFNTLLASGQAEGTLKKTDGRTTLETQASITTIRDATTIDDLESGLKRTALTFTAEPYWYGALKTIAFTTTTGVSLNTAAKRNEGNARAVKHVSLILTTNITASAGSPFTITMTPTTGTAAVLQIVGNMTAVITINAGANTVVANGAAAYDKVSRAATQRPLLFIEGQQLISDGSLAINNSALSFSSAVSGSIAFRDTWV